jgi:hypothetical protein
VNSACDELLACPRLAENAYARLAGGDTIGTAHDSLHCRGAPHQLVSTDSFAQPPVLSLQPRQFYSVIDRQQQLVGRKRFFQKVDRAQLRRPHGHFDRRLSGDHHHRGFDTGRSNVRQKLKTIAPGHNHIGEDHVEGLHTKLFERTIRAVANNCLVAGHAECASERG